MSLGSRIAGVVGGTRRARIVTAATVLAVAAAVIAFVALDADDDGNPGSGETPYQGQADQICVEGKRMLGAAGPRTLNGPPPQFTNYARVAARINELTRGRLARLDPPDDLRERAAELDAALRGMQRPLDQLEQAGRTANPGELQAAASEVQAASQRSEQAIEALGLDACARLKVGLLRLRPR